MIVFLSSRPTLSIQQHPPSAAISIQRPAQPRDAATRITLPSHPAIGAQKQQLHTMAQVGCKGETLLPLSGVVWIYIWVDKMKWIWEKNIMLEIDVLYSPCSMIPS